MFSWPIASLIAGCLTTLAFAPFDLSWLVFFTVAAVFYLWTNLPAKQALISAWLFGLGLQCTGVSWIYYSLHVHGSAPVLFAIILVFLLCCYLSIYTALSVYVVNRYLPDNTVLRLMFFYPASWVVFEWLQGYVMTGFSWMQLGYTQIDLPLSGFAPVLGNHAISGLIAVCAGALALLFKQRSDLKIKKVVIVVLPVISLWLTGVLLKPLNWTVSEGAPIKVSVIQGNIAQKDKWSPRVKQASLTMYRDLSLAQTDVDLIVWPETAVPDYRYRKLQYLDQLSIDMKAHDTDLLLGIFVKNDENRTLNSVVNVNGGIYNKRHLVPLGEYIPLRFLIEFFNRFVKIPMSDIDSGDENQKLLTGAGVPL
ncbi:MAG: apolipoprotein N-acyltransferase, partial [Gammaproteobacteria bacterium]